MDQRESGRVTSKPLVKLLDSLCSIVRTQYVLQSGLAKKQRCPNLVVFDRVMTHAADGVFDGVDESTGGFEPPSDTSISELICKEVAVSIDDAVC